MNATRLTAFVLSFATALSLALVPAHATQRTKTITRFDDFDPSEYALTLSGVERPSEQDILSLMPDTLTATLSGGDTEEIPVEWFCITDDYEEKRYYLYEYDAQWDETVYTLDNPAQRPYILVSLDLHIDENESLSTQAVVENRSSEEEQTITFLMNEMGLNQAQACGIMANIFAECSFIPNNLQNYYESNVLDKQYTDASYTKAVNNGSYRFSGSRADGKKTKCTNARDSFMNDHAGYGIVQWTWWTRKRDFYDYAKSKEVLDIGDLTTQLEFLKKEIETSYSSMLKTMKKLPNTAKGAYDAASLFCEKYERPSKLEERMAERGNYAKDKYWNEYKDFIPKGSLLSETIFEYNGTAHEPQVNIISFTTENYSVLYSGNVDAGTAKVSITTANQDGEETEIASEEFYINQRSIASASISQSAASVYYTGKSKKVGITVTDTLNEQIVTLTEGKDYTLTFSDNIQIGTATVTVTGIGNYSGAVSKTFRILPTKTGAESVVSKKAKQLTYTWKKNTSCTGYQVQIATDKGFTKNVKSKTITKNSTLSYTSPTTLKAKTKYYIRMRSYKTVNGITYYSGWTVYGKTVKTK